MHGQVLFFIFYYRFIGGQANWIDVLTRDEYRTIIIESLNNCVQHKGLIQHAFCLDSNRDA